MHPSTRLVLLLLPLTLALPSPQVFTAAGLIPANNCTTRCASTIKCPTLFPSSCICHNQSVADCAKKCGQEPTPTPQDCTVKPDKCMTICRGTYDCTGMWPQSCYCDNKVTIACSFECGVRTPELWECPPLPTLTLAPAETAKVRA
ncbi:hypothetical protein BZA05DRAFT_471627 [Tricharina praecox]|uniref:uncharacterized protein n=1 Tax=Tricharina praecox TaxID=43433 RepID=UPI002220013E|nr:uncharacterized protein BZA05DRAFT_471627 [Tricharina praecox]KAI5856604.1 hypothetical protein BZA05DRAFT_471627 [Tricharina praecox]